MSRLDVAAVRRRFPALERVDSGRLAAYLDGPGGTQVPGEVIVAMRQVLERGVSNLGGEFAPSDEAERIVEGGRRAVADLLGTGPDQICFGQNMTTITFAVSRALAREWRQGDAIVLTRLDHDANYTPWRRAATAAGIEVRTADFDPGDGTLHPDAIAELLDPRVRLVAVCLASNALGTVVDVAAVVESAHQVGAKVYVDAVHACPHLRVDVSAFGCDFLVASAYKFFGPHTGVLYGKREHLEALDFDRVRPAPAHPPGKLETGTQSFESIAGVTAAVDYLASLGGGGEDRRRSLAAAYTAISAHEVELSRRFLDGIAAMPWVQLHGPPRAGQDRVATFSVTVKGRDAGEVAAEMARAAVYVWTGDFYAVNLVDRLGLRQRGGLVRIGFVHYNTSEEVGRALDVLETLRPA